MLRKILIRKVTVASSLLLIIFMMYLIPVNKNDKKIKQKLEYIGSNDKIAIYLLDEYDYVSRVIVPVNISNTEDTVFNLVNVLANQEIIPKKFKSLLPSGTTILNLSLNNKILKIDFSKEFNNISEYYEEKLIESLIYTLTSLNGIDALDIYVDNNKLTQLPNSKKKLPDLLDKSYGINKTYEITSLNDIDSYTIYYANSSGEDSYYIPVTKYINNDNQDKVKVIIDELSTSLIYETNLASFLDTNAKLLDYEIMDKEIKLNFNDKILSNITNSIILEEVMYTIGLSLCDELNLEKVIFNVENRKVATFNLE